MNCTIDSLAVGESATFTFDVFGSLARLASTSVRFRFPDFGRDPNFPNNSDDASYTVFDPDA